MIEQSVEVLDMKQQFELGMMPTKQDYIVKNGKTIPNSSKNKWREPPTY